MKTSNGYPQVVIVDDEEYILEFMKTDLESNGFEVLTFSCPNEAIAALVDAKGPSTTECECLMDGFFLITDYRMPDVSGLDMIDLLNNNEAKILSSILLTGLIPSDELERANQMESVDIMEKPVDIDLIVEKVKSLAYKKIKSSDKSEAPLVE